MSESQKDQNAQGGEAAEANNQQAKSAAAAAAEQENLKEYKNLMDDKALDELDHVAEGEDKSVRLPCFNVPLFCIAITGASSCVVDCRHNKESKLHPK